MLRLLYLHRFTSFGVILCVGGIMLLLHLLLSFSFYSNPGPRTTRPSGHSLVLCENASSFSKQGEKTSAHLRLVAFTDPHTTYPEMKTKGTTTSKKCHIILYAIPADEMRQLQDVSPCQPWPGGFLSFGLTLVAKYNQHVGLFRLFSQAA